MFPYYGLLRALASKASYERLLLRLPHLVLLRVGTIAFYDNVRT